MDDGPAPSAAFFNKYQSAHESDERAKDMVRVEVEREKQEFLLELIKFKQSGIELTRHYTMDDSLEDIEFEYTRIKTHLDTVNNVNFIRDTMFIGFQGIEMANAQWGPVLHLNGWSRSVQADKKRYDHVLERLYKKHWRMGNMSPEAELGWLIGSSMVMHHFRHKWGVADSSTNAPDAPAKAKFDLMSMLGMFMPGGEKLPFSSQRQPQPAPFVSAPSTPMHPPPPPAHVMRAPPPPARAPPASVRARPSDVVLTPPSSFPPEKDGEGVETRVQPPDDSVRRELEAARAMLAQTQRQSEVQINMMRQQMQGMMHTLQQQQFQIQQQQQLQAQQRRQPPRPELVVHTGDTTPPNVPPAPRNAPVPVVSMTPRVEPVEEGAAESSVFNMSSSEDSSDSSSEREVKETAPRTPQTPARDRSDDRDISIVGSASRRRTPAGGRGRGTPARAASPVVDALRLDL